MILTGTITNPDGSSTHIEAESDTYEEARKTSTHFLKRAKTSLLFVRIANPREAGPA